MCVSKAKTGGHLKEKTNNIIEKKDIFKLIEYFKSISRSQYIRNKKYRSFFVYTFYPKQNPLQHKLSQRAGKSSSPSFIGITKT
jgi:hypothetical protein